MIIAFIMYLVMIFLHIFADFHLQGILAQMKMRIWWNENNYTDKKNKYDYLVGLFVHALEWSFVIMIPMLWQIYTDPTAFAFIVYLIFLFGNMAMHANVDDKKANRKQINLAEDQIFHVMQIAVTWLFWTVVFGW